jgi:hypothetical protein
MPTPEELQTAVGIWLSEALERLPAKARPFAAEFAAHLGAEPVGLPIVAEKLLAAEHANLQRALEAYTGGSVQWRGVAGMNKRLGGITLSDLVESRGSQCAPRPGPVEYTNRPVGPLETLACIQFGYGLIEQEEGRAVIFVRGPTEHTHPPTGQIEVMATERDTAERVLWRLRALMTELNVYRGRTITFAFNPHGAHSIAFTQLPRVEPALAARPGRIDQALEMPLPDASSRPRLIELHGRGLELDLQDWDHHLARTEGVSPALIEELMRRAATTALEGGSARVTDPILEEALEEMLAGGSRLAGLLGSRR